MNVRAYPQRHQSETGTLRGALALAGIDDSSLLQRNPSDLLSIPRCDDISRNDLSAGVDFAILPYLLCYTNDVYRTGYKYAWEMSDGSGSSEECKFVPNKPYSDGGDCDSKGANNCGTGSIGPGQAPALRSDDSGLGSDVPRDEVCDIKGVYQYCTPEHILVTVKYIANQERGYEIKDIKEEKDNPKCQKCRVPLC